MFICLPAKVIMTDCLILVWIFVEIYFHFFVFTCVTDQNIFIAVIEPFHFILFTTGSVTLPDDYCYLRKFMNLEFVTMVLLYQKVKFSKSKAFRLQLWFFRLKDQYYLAIDKVCVYFLQYFKPK